MKIKILLTYQFIKNNWIVHFTSKDETLNFSEYQNKHNHSNRLARQLINMVERWNEEDLAIAEESPIEEEYEEEIILTPDEEFTDQEVLDLYPYAIKDELEVFKIVREYFKSIKVDLDIEIKLTQN